MSGRCPEFEVGAERQLHRRGLALLLSCVFHLACLLALSLQVARASYGLLPGGSTQEGASESGGAQVFSIQIFRESSIQANDVSKGASVLRKSAEGQTAQPSSEVPSLATVAIPAAPGVPEADSRQGSETSAALALKVKSGGAKQRTQEDGGRHDFGADFLKVIAPCLPKGSSPRLPLAHLVVRFDSGGALSAPPRVEALGPIGGSDAAKAADRVVQAALRCGPYPEDRFAGQTLSLAIDFSGEAPLVVDEDSP